MKIKPTIPFDFVLNELFELEPRVQRMFGAYGIYIGEKMYFVLRESEKKTEDNGIWVATQLEFHDSLKEMIPDLRNFTSVRIKKWLILPIEAEDFEESAVRMCEMIKSGHPAIGVIPQRKKKKKN